MPQPRNQGSWSVAFCASLLLSQKRWLGCVAVDLTGARYEGSLGFEDDASGLTMGPGGTVFVHEGLCFHDSMTALHQVEFRAARGGPPLVGLQFLLLRSQGLDDSGGRTFKVAYVSDSIPNDSSEIFVLKRKENMHEGGTGFLSSEVPPGQEVVVVFPVIYGQTGDCLGWYHGSSSKGAIASWKSSTPGRMWQTSSASQPVADSVLSTTSPTLNGLEFAVAWRIAMPIAALQHLPRDQRLRSLKESVEVTGTVPGSTSPAFKQDLLAFFGESGWATRAAVEVGAAAGTTTAVLASIFGIVYALEAFVLRPRYPWTPQPRTKDLANVVNLVVDSGQPYAFSILASNDIRVAVIDGDHDASHVFSDTFGVLHDIPCCVEVVAYHDFCADDVFNTIQLFVDADLLRFRQSIGMPRWNMWWCKDGRSEGAIFEVRRDAPNWRQTLETLRRAFSKQGHTVADAAKILNGSFWTLQDRGEMAILEMKLPPSRAQLHWLPSTGRQDTVDLGHVRIQGWHKGVVEPLYSSEALLAEIWTTQRQSGGRGATVVFDRDLMGFTMSTLNRDGRPLTPGLPAALVGVRQKTLHTTAVTAAINGRTVSW